MPPRKCFGIFCALRQLLEANICLTDIDEPNSNYFLGGGGGGSCPGPLPPLSYTTVVSPCFIASCKWRAVLASACS